MSHSRLSVFSRLLVHLFGTTLVDERTGANLPKMLVFSFWGKVHVFSLGDSLPLVPHFHTQDRARFTHQSMGFKTHAPPDFPRVEPQAGEEK